VEYKVAPTSMVGCQFGSGTILATIAGGSMIGYREPVDDIESGAFLEIPVAIVNLFH